MSMWSFSRFRNLFAAIGIFAVWYGSWHFLDKALAWRPQGQNSFYAINTAVTVGTGSALAIANDPARTILHMCNDSASATVFWQWAQAGAAALNTAGSHPLPPLSCVFYSDTRAIDGVNMIASASSTPVTIDAWR